MTDYGDIRRLLIVKMSALGDVVMTLPALTALKESFPGMEVDWLVEPPAAGLIQGHPLLNRVIVSPRKTLGRLIKSGRLLSARRLGSSFLRELQAVEYDAVIDLQGLIKSAAMVRLVNARRKIGFARTREHSGWALNEKMPAYDLDRHAALRYLDAVAYLGAEISEEAPDKYFFPSSKAVEAAGKLLPAEGYLVLNPGAKWSTKRWPLPHWVALAYKLADKTDLALVVTGGPEDQEQGQAIERAVPGRVWNFCGQTALPVLAAILEGALMTITADTGPMHLAAAVGGGGLALFGPTKPWRTGPFGGHFRIMAPPKDCLGCLKKKCGLDCLELLGPDEVLTNALDYLAADGKVAS